MELHDDDKPVGRVLSRREVLALLGGGSAAMLTMLGLPRLVAAQGSATATPTVTSSPTPVPECVVRPELTEGPYFVDNQLNRSDIRVDPADGSIKPGTPLYLRYRVFNVTDNVCAALAGAQVDVWHCDAEGVYSGVQDRSFDTREQKWLRGYQITDQFGIADFLTIVPGWYPGRAVHIHFKIRTQGANQQAYEFTSQLFFDPATIETIYADSPYAEKGLPNVPNERDSIFRASGEMLTLKLEQRPNGEAGYNAVFDIALDLSDT
ncbi:MAG: intradiol ring-cleavage dioxygenase [Anaerolineae bacterium]